MTIWEYSVFIVDPAHMTKSGPGSMAELLKNKGLQGWELAQVVVKEDFFNYVIFKRPQE